MINCRSAALIAVASMAAMNSHAGEVKTDGADLIINTKSGLSIETVDGDYSFEIGGRLMYDYDNTETDSVTTKDDFGIRRARMYFKGDIKDWAYKVQFNVGNGNGGEEEDLYVRYNGFGKKAKITVGHQKEHFGFEQMTSSNDLNILERNALTEAYTPARNYGVQVEGSQHRLFYALGVFQDDDNNDNTAITGRVVYNPIKTADSVVHLGAAYSDRSSNGEMLGLEFVATKGPFAIQSEYFDTELNGVDGEGYYLHLGWIITGETRPYKNDRFKRVKPESSKGAWEITVRYVDGDGKFSDEGLGTTDASAVTIGLNYYLNKHVRFGVSYSDAEDNVTGISGNEFRTRLQLNF